MIKKYLIPLMMTMVASLLCSLDKADASAIRLNPGFGTNVLPGNDDGSTGLVPIGFNVNFFGLAASSLYVNNNGNVTFTGPLATYTPFGLLATSTPIIAPFFADVETRGSINDVTYGQDVVNGQAAFGVNWFDVGYYNQNLDRLNTFQLVITDRSDIALGDFDFEFNYDTIQWETGDASGGVGGLGGFSATAGWSNGTDASLELLGSAINGAFLDGGANALVSGSLNSSEAGRDVFNVRSGVVQPPDSNSVPDAGSTMMLMGMALTAIVGIRSRLS